MSTLKESILLPDARVVFLSTKPINSFLKDNVADQNPGKVCNPQLCFNVCRVYTLRIDLIETFVAENSSSFIIMPEFVSCARITRHRTLCQTRADIPQGHLS